MPVILYHAGSSWFTGGFIGVDVFFVISGYLITQIIANEIFAGEFTFSGFYERRFRRIMPALLFVIISCLPFAWTLMTPLQFDIFVDSGLASILFSSNIYFWLTQDYFNALSDQQPLLHTWSLAVEEQYYILFPIFMIVMYRLRPRLIGPTLLGVAALSLAISHWAAFASPSAGFYLPVTRAWELLAGSLAAWINLRRPMPGHDGAALLGIAGIVGAIVLFDERTPLPSAYALAPVGGTALVLLFARTGTLTARVLSLRPMVAIGLISYSAYLWHQPIFAFARLGHGSEPPFAAMLALSALALALAWLTWRFVESPFRRRTPHMRPWAAVARFSAACLVVAAGFGAMRVSGVQERAYLAAMTPEERHIYAVLHDIRTANHNDAFDDGACRFRTEALSDAFAARFTACAAAHGRALVILGDSHGIDLYRAAAPLVERPFVVGIVQGGCRPHTVGRGAACEYPETAAFLKRHAADVAAAVFMQAGFYLFEDPAGTEADRKTFAGRRIRPLALHDSNIAADAAYLDDLGGVVDVYWLGPWLEPHLGLDALIGRDCAAPGIALTEGVAANFMALDAALAMRAEGRSYRYVSSMDLLKFDPEQDIFNCTDIFWSDTDHWSAAGEARFGRRLAPFFDGLDARSEAAN